MYSLREVEESDHAWLVELHNDPAVLKNVTCPDPITLQSHLAWWCRIQASNSEERLIFCIDGVRAGFVKFYRIDKTNLCCDLGADLHIDFRGKRHAKHMWGLMISRCFNVHRLNRVALTTAEYNEVGNHLYRSLGFKKEGEKVSSLLRDGVFYNETCMYLLRKDYNEESSTDS